MGKKTSNAEHRTPKAHWSPNA